jgi:hypothetical protein
MFSRWRQRRADAKFDAERRKKAVLDVHAQGELFPATFALDADATASLDAALLDPANIAVAQAAYAKSRAEGANHAEAVSAAESAYNAATDAALASFTDALTKRIAGSGRIAAGDNRTAGESAARIAQDVHHPWGLKGDELLVACRSSMDGLVEHAQRIASVYDVADQVEAAWNRVFAFNLMVRGAASETWRDFIEFNVRTAIHHRGVRNAALARVPDDADPWSVELALEAHDWAEDEYGSFVELLPDDWFILTLGDGRQTVPHGVRSNLVDEFCFAVTGLIAMDSLDEADFRALYVPVHPIAPLGELFALAS